MNDAFVIKNGKIATATNYSGGIQGGISNGEEISFRVVFKATPTISKNKTPLIQTANKLSFRHTDGMTPALCQEQCLW